MPKRESNVRMSNYENNCRFCLEKFGLVNVSLFSEDDAVEDDFISGDSYERETVTEMVQYCTGIDISPKDKLPQYMCTQCLEKLLQCNRFRRQCLRSAEILKEALSKNLNELDEASDLYDVIADSVGTGDIEIDEELLLGSCDAIDDIMTKTARLFPVDQLLERETQELGLNHNSGVFDATVDSENWKESQIAEKGVILRDEELNHIWTKLYKPFSVDIDLRNEHDIICGDSLGTTVSNNSNGSEVIDFFCNDTETIRLDERCKKPLAVFTSRRNGRKRSFSRRKRKRLAEKCQICGEMRAYLKSHMLNIHRDLITTGDSNSNLKVLESKNNEQNQNEQPIYVGLGSTNLDKRFKELEKPLEIPVKKKRKRKNMRFRTGRQRHQKLAEKCQICGKMRIYLKKHMLTIHRDLITTGYGNNNNVLESQNNRQNQNEQSISVGLGSTNFESSHSKVLQGQAHEIKVGIKQRSEHIKLSETERGKLIHVDCDNVVSEVIKNHCIEFKKVSLEEETKDDTGIQTLETSAKRRKSQTYEHTERIELKSLESKCQISREQYKCDLCNMKFLLKKDLILHLNRNEPYFWKKCSDCDEEFYNNCVFMKHLQNSHLYKCDVCNKGFMYKQSCTQHKQMHV